MFSRLARRQISYKTDKDTTQTSDIRAKLTSQDSGNCGKVTDCVIPKFSKNWQVNKSAHCTIINHEGSCQEHADNLWVNTVNNDLEAVKGHQLFIPTLVHYSAASLHSCCCFRELNMWMKSCLVFGFKCVFSNICLALSKLLDWSWLSHHLLPKEQIW